MTLSEMQDSNNSSIKETSTKSELTRSAYSHKYKTKSQTKILYYGSTEDILKWMKKYCGQYHQLYSHLFKEQDISGRALARMNDIKLTRLGIIDPFHRQELLRHILRLKLETELKDFKAMDQSTFPIDSTKK